MNSMPHMYHIVYVYRSYMYIGMIFTGLVCISVKIPSGDDSITLKLTQDTYSISRWSVVSGRGRLRRSIARGIRSTAWCSKIWRRSTWRWGGDVVVIMIHTEDIYHYHHPTTITTTTNKKPSLPSPPLSPPRPPATLSQPQPPP